MTWRAIFLADNATSTDADSARSLCMTMPRHNSQQCPNTKYTLLEQRPDYSHQSTGVQNALVDVPGNMTKCVKPLGHLATSSTKKSKWSVLIGRAGTK